MRRLLAVSLIAIGLAGCAPSPYMEPLGPPVVVYHQNPVLVPATQPECVWETVVDVVDDYFPIGHEEPIRIVGSEATVGWLDTVPQISPTILEPWRADGAGPGERLENTLQSMRRFAVVRVYPGEGGYWVDVLVQKELEDVVRPEHATAGAATLRYDDTLRRVVNPVGGQEITEGWIPQGRDTALEQKMIGHLLARFNPAQAGGPMLFP